MTVGAFGSDEMFPVITDPRSVVIRHPQGTGKQEHFGQALLFKFVPLQKSKALYVLLATLAHNYQENDFKITD